MNTVLENEGFKRFQPLSLRTSMIPSNIPLDTASLIDLFDDLILKQLRLTKREIIHNISQYKEIVWSVFFKDHKVLKQKSYTFNHYIQTDGVSVSLTFVKTEVRRNAKGRVLVPKQKKDEKEFFHVDELSDEQLEGLKDKTIVGVDPGKYNLVYLTDGVKVGKKIRHLRYTAFGRRNEMLTRKSQRATMKMKDRENISQKEANFGKDHCSKTMNPDKFKEYLKHKNKLDAQLCKFYGRKVFRKMRFRSYSYGNRSMDKFVHNIKTTFGENIVIAYGDWKRSTQMKHFVPTKGIGLLRRIAKRFETVLVDEFRTSKLCCICSNVLSNKEYRCLLCKECRSESGRSESGHIKFLTRDLNSAMNIRRLAIEWINAKERPLPFRRDVKLTTETEEE
jgi:hypothetical protein